MRFLNKQGMLFSSCGNITKITKHNLHSGNVATVKHRYQFFTINDRYRASVIG